MAQFLLFDGAMNKTYLGLQAYIWVMLLFFILAVGSYIVWYFFFWAPLKPVQGHFTAHTRKINSALTFDENLNFLMQSEKKAKLIFDITVKEAKKLQKDWEYAPSGLIGKVLCDLVFDGGGWTKLDSPVRAIIERVASTYNDAHPDDMIMTLGKFHKRLIAGKLDGIEGVSEIPTTYLVPWARIDAAIPRDHEQPMWDGYLRQLARQKDNEENNPDNKYLGYLIIVGGIFVSLTMIGAKLIS